MTDAKEEETSKTRVTRRKLRAVPSKALLETVEEKAVREAKLAAERVLRDAILLIQSHERARVGRCHAADGD